jgi:hypothetical protein
MRDARFSPEHSWRLLEGTPVAGIVGFTPGIAGARDDFAHALRTGAQSRLPK